MWEKNISTGLTLSPKPTLKYTCKPLTPSPAICANNNLC